VPLVDCCGGTGLSGCEVDQALKCRQLIVVEVQLCQVPQLDNFRGQCRQFHSREVQRRNFLNVACSIISVSFHCSLVNLIEVCGALGMTTILVK